MLTDNKKHNNIEIDLTNKSKFISLILRHKPETIGIKLDKHGYANVNELLEGVNINFDTLEKIVREDEKGRYSFNEDKTKIRANQGHTINVDVELEEKIPPDILYHGTATKYEESINRKGLIAKERLYVHMTDDLENAKKVGARHGKLIVYEIDAKQMAKDGIKFYLSVNNVWMTKKVDVKYLTLMNVK